MELVIRISDYKLDFSSIRMPIHGGISNTL